MPVVYPPLGPGQSFAPDPTGNVRAGLSGLAKIIGAVNLRKKIDKEKEKALKTEKQDRSILEELLQGPGTEPGQLSNVPGGAPLSPEAQQSQLEVTGRPAPQRPQVPVQTPLSQLVGQGQGPLSPVEQGLAQGAIKQQFTTPKPPKDSTLKGLSDTQIMTAIRIIDSKLADPTLDFNEGAKDRFTRMRNNYLRVAQERKLLPGDTNFSPPPTTKTPGLRKRVLSEVEELKKNRASYSDVKAFIQNQHNIDIDKIGIKKW